MNGEKKQFNNFQRANLKAARNCLINVQATIRVFEDEYETLGELVQTIEDLLGIS